jgi:hypothetical protein
MSKRTADLIVISSHAEASPIVHCAPQLACVNRKIAERVTNSSNAHVHSIFAEAAFLAGKAIEAATELQRMPGMSAEAFAETLDFWRRVRDHAGTAALDSLGGNSTLAEALVTFRLLHQQLGSRVAKAARPQR